MLSGHRFPPHTPSLAGCIYYIENVWHNKFDLVNYSHFLSTKVAPLPVFEIHISAFAILHKMYCVIFIYTHGPYGLLHE